MAGMRRHGLGEEEIVRYTDKLGNVTMFISVRAFAKKQGVSTQTVYNWLGNNTLTNKLEIGGRTFIPENAEKPASRL